MKPKEVAALLDELHRIETEVRQVKVPLSFTDQLYHLREHIDMVRREVAVPPALKD